MDKATKELANKVTALEKIVHELRNAPRKNDPNPIGPQDDPEEQRKAGPGKPPLSDGGTAHTSGKTGKRTDNRPPWWRRMWVWKPWKRILGVLAGLAGIGYAIITYRQWCDLRHNFEIDERAYVTVGRVTMTDETIIPAGDRELGTIITLHFDNYGHLPSIGLKGIVMGYIGKDGGGVMPIGADMTKVFPGKDSYIFSFHQRKLTDKDIADFRVNHPSAPDRPMGIFGDLTYGTGFGKQETEHFCFSYIVPVQDWVVCDVGSGSKKR